VALAVEANAARRRLEAEHGAAVVVSTCNGLTAVVPGLVAQGRWVLHQHYAPPRRLGLLAGAVLRRAEHRRRRRGGRVAVAVPDADWIERWGRAAPGLDVVQLAMTGAEPEPIPMADARARLGLPAEGPIVTCLGGFDPSKDIATLVEAAHRAHAVAGTASLPGAGAPLVVLAGGVVDMVPDDVRRQPPSWLVLRPGRYAEAERLLLPAAADGVVWSFRPRHRRASATLTDDLSVGTPVLASAPSRVAREVEAHGLGATFPAGDPDALAEVLLDVTGRLPPRTQVLEAAAGPLSRRAAARAHLEVLGASESEASARSSPLSSC
jgi:glycosyltransferase involved in cell wall biosynthesis